MWKKCRTWYRTAEVIISPGETEQRETQREEESFALEPLQATECIFFPNLTQQWNCSIFKVTLPTTCNASPSFESDSYLDKWCHQWSSPEDTRPCHQTSYETYKILLLPGSGSYGSWSTWGRDEGKGETLPSEIYYQCFEISMTEEALTDRTHGWHFQTSTLKTVWWRMLRRRKCNMDQCTTFVLVLETQCFCV